MRLERMSVALRQRTPWEAMDLGMALARRHALAAWKPWLALSLPLFVLFNALGWWLDRLWLAPLLMWWCKPLFERATLYVLSRAVFGEAPDWRRAIRAPEVWRARSLLAWLSWRRLHPARALLLPVDLLENLQGNRRVLRTAVLQRAVGSQAWGLLVAGFAFEWVLVASLWMLTLAVAPVSLLDDQAQRMWALFITAPPTWAQMAGNLALWMASSAIGPLVVGAGFGLYLNRRTQLEAWDVELVFRRLAARVREASWVPVLLVVALLGALSGATPALAVERDKPLPKKATVAQPLDARRFVGEGDWRAPDGAFARAVAKAYADPQLSPTQEVKQWKFKYPWKPKAGEQRAKTPGWVKVLAWIAGAIAEYGLWILVAVLGALLLWKLPRWLRWVSDALPDPQAPSPVVEQAVAELPPLPVDVAAVAESLWNGGQRREALALLYRASVEAIATRLGAPFPPGATEAECLRRARRLPDAEASGEFARMVRAWQAAAYAWRFPDAQGFADLLAGWRRQFGAQA